MRTRSNQNFFHWLDYGGGKQLSLPGCDRERLDRERIRYLSKDERRDYLVRVEDGKLCWENGEPITTNTDWKDSIHGIVPKDDPTPAFGDGTVMENQAEQPNCAQQSTEDQGYVKTYMQFLTSLPTVVAQRPQRSM